MQSFLGKTAGYILEKYGDCTGELCIVLPGRRAGLFLRQYLAERAGKTIWSPEIYSIEDFIHKLCGLSQLDTTALLFNLYEIYREEHDKIAEPFDEFCGWAQVFVHDINDIDRALADPAQLFGNLKNIRYIENWSLSQEELTDFQRQYLEFYLSLGNLYEKLKRKLIKEKKVYDGLAYRIVSEQLEDKLGQWPWRKVIFAGFNALNAAEEKIIRLLYERGKAELLWDSDSYYINDYAQEAGKFLRTLMPAFKKEKNNITRWCENSFSDSAKKITVIGAAKNTAQAAAAGLILRDLRLAQNDLQKTALVLADENLLFPVLHSIPEEISSVNVTMGYPLKFTPFADLAYILFNLHEHARITEREPGKQTRFYHKALIRLLSHPYTRYIFAHPVFPYRLKQEIIKRNYIFLSVDDIRSFTSDEHIAELGKLEKLLPAWNNSEDALACFEELIEMLRLQFMNGKESTAIEAEYLLGFSKLFKRIKTLLKEFKTELGIKTLHALVKQLTAASSFPFYGEPLSGLQVMGLLETRTLDFENVIMLSVNENVIPAAKSQHSFIPFDLRKAFGLPVYSDRDAVFSYHFYRLLQRAKNIYLVYNTETDEFGKGEKSRFITQLLYELPRINPHIVIEEKFAVTENKAWKTETLSVNKTEEVMQKLEERAEKGLSPSALGVYKKCTLQFYLRYIAGLRETDEVEEIIGTDTLGSAIHKVLEELYRPFAGKFLKKEDIRQMRNDAEKLTEHAFLEFYSSRELMQGKNLLTLRIAVKYINRFLDAEIILLDHLEKENKSLRILELEKPLEHILDNGKRKILLRGNADRIDSISGLTRILDYKTGRAENKELKIEEWEAVIRDHRLNKGFQLMMYALMYNNENKNKTNDSNRSAPMQAGIISFREPGAGLKTVEINGKNLLDSESIFHFRENLVVLMNEIFDDKRPFVQTDDPEICFHCSFRTICNK